MILEAAWYERKIGWLFPNLQTLVAEKKDLGDLRKSIFMN